MRIRRCMGNGAPYIPMWLIGGYGLNGRDDPCLLDYAIDCLSFLGV